jgi:hypothetical protein
MVHACTQSSGPALIPESLPPAAALPEPLQTVLPGALARCTAWLRFATYLQVRPYPQGHTGGRLIYCRWRYLRLALAGEPK